MGSSFTESNRASTLEVAITIALWSSSMQSVISFQEILMGSDLKLVWLLALYHIVSGYHYMFGSCILTGSLESDIWKSVTLRASSPRIMFQSASSAT